MSTVDVSALQNRVRFIAEDAMLLGTDQTRNDIASTAPIASGRLAGAFTQTLSAGGDRITATISNNTAYARYVTEGTAPHEIRAVNAKTLAFYWPKAGRTVFPVSVQHPGTQPNLFWQDGLALWTTNVQAAIR